MKKFFVLMMGTVLIASCNSVEKDKSGSFIGGDIEIMVSSASGVDLLNPVNQGAYLEKDIKIFYIIDGKDVEIYNESRDYPRNFCIEAPGTGDSKYYMVLFINTYKDNAETIIKWNDSDSDTVKVGITSGDNYLFCTKVWYNNVLMYDGDGINGLYFDVTK